MNTSCQKRQTVTYLYKMIDNFFTECPLTPFDSPFNITSWHVQLTWLRWWLPRQCMWGDWKYSCFSHWHHNKWLLLKDYSYLALKQFFSVIITLAKLVCAGSLPIIKHVLTIYKLLCVLYAFTKWLCSPSVRKSSVIYFSTMCEPKILYCYKCMPGLIKRNYFIK